MKPETEILELAHRFGIPAGPETRMPSSLERDFGLSLLERTGYGPLDHRALGNVLSYLDERDADQLARLLPILLVSLCLQPEAEDLYDRLSYLGTPLRDDTARTEFGESLRRLYSVDQLDRLNTLVSEIIARVAIAERDVLSLQELVKVKGALCDTAFAKTVGS